MKLYLFSVYPFTVRLRMLGVHATAGRFSREKPGEHRSSTSTVWVKHYLSGFIETQRTTRDASQQAAWERLMAHPEED